MQDDDQHHEENDEVCPQVSGEDVYIIPLEVHISISIHQQPSHHLQVLQYLT